MQERHQTAPTTDRMLMEWKEKHLKSYPFKHRSKKTDHQVDFLPLLSSSSNWMLLRGFSLSDWEISDEQNNIVHESTRAPSRSHLYTASQRERESEFKF